MNIVHVTPYYPPHIGGVEEVAKNLSEALATRNNQITIITSNISQKKPKKQPKFLDFEPQSSLEIGHVPFSPFLFGSIFRALKKADVLHVHAGIAYYPEVSLFAAKIQKKPIIVTFHCDTEPSGPLGFFLPLYKNLFLGRMLRLADKVVCLTKDHALVAQKVYHVPKKKIVIIPNGIDELFFSMRSPKIKKGGVIRLLFVGRLVKQKNVSRLIDAVKIIQKKRPVLLRIVGTGEEEKMLKEKTMLDGLEESIQFLGAFNKDNKQKWENTFSQSDIFVVSSDYEGVPVALMEAMAVGLPAVATNVRGIKDIAGGTLVLAKPNPKSLADSIEKAFFDVRLRKTLASKAKKTAKRLHWGRIAREYESIYAGVVH